MKDIKIRSCFLDVHLKTEMLQAGRMKKERMFHISAVQAMEEERTKSWTSRDEDR